MKEQIKAPGKIQLTNEDTANLSDAQFKTLLIRMFTELIELGQKLKEQMKATQCEIMQNIQGNCEGKLVLINGTQINALEQKEEINIQPTRTE